MNAAAGMHLRTRRRRRPVSWASLAMRMSVTLLVVVSPSSWSFADGSTDEVMRSSQLYGSDIAAASRRFGVPEAWIRAVLHAESRGQPRAISPAGAMGLMQIMPGTWRELRGRHGLGHDPFAPRDNILAGAAYLGELHARFGVPGFLAAYNAGPSRYRDHLTHGRALPAQTIAYVAEIAPRLGMPDLPAAAINRSPGRGNYARAQLFVGRGNDQVSVNRTPFENATVRASRRRVSAESTQGAGLFVARARAPDQR